MLLAKYVTFHEVHTEVVPLAASAGHYGFLFRNEKRKVGDDRHYYCSSDYIFIQIQRERTF